MDTSLNVANAWQRLLRRRLLAASLPTAAANDDSVLDDRAPAGDSPFDCAETLPVLYRSEAFAEDLLDSHPQLA